MNNPKPQFVWTAEGPESASWLTTDCTDCVLIIEPRAPHCDRGHYYAKVFVKEGHELKLHVDSQDGWPRYYFDLSRAIAECEAWLVRRSQSPSIE